MSERIGFLGLGIMGSRMAARIVAAGWPTTVWTRSPGRAVRWAEQHGAQAVRTPAEVAAASDIVVSMVVDGDQVSSVLLGEEGVVSGARPGLLCVDMSTIGPGETRRIGAGLATAGLAMVDAPVSGSAPRAESGNLTIMAGGSPSDVARARPLLELMGSLVVHVGELGEGQMLKLVNNALAAANAAAVAEALVLARAVGLDVDALVEVVGSGSGGSAQLQLKAEAMLARDYATLFKSEHMLKDVRLCLDEAQRAGVPFPSAAHARDLLAETVERGHGESDYAALIESVHGGNGTRAG